MRKDETLRRVNEVIQADKSVMSEACKALIIRDFAEQFNEYFDLIGLPNLSINCQNGEYDIGITFKAERIKKFNVLK